MIQADHTQDALKGKVPGAASWSKGFEAAAQAEMGTGKPGEMGDLGQHIV